MSLGHRLQESWDRRSHSPNSPLQPATRCPSSYRPRGPQSHPVGRRDRCSILKVPVSRSNGWRPQSGRGREGSHLAGVPAIAPRTQHVVLDKLVLQAVLLPADLLRHDGDLHLLQVVGWGQRLCGKKPSEPVVLGAHRWCVPGPHSEPQCPRGTLGGRYPGLQLSGFIPGQWADNLYADTVGTKLQNEAKE